MVFNIFLKYTLLTIEYYHNRRCKLAPRYTIDNLNRMAAVAQKFLFLALLACGLPGRAQTASPAIPIHDPVLTRQNGTYYLFATGRGITVWSSKDRRT